MSVLRCTMFTSTKLPNTIQGIVPVQLESTVANGATPNNAYPNIKQIEAIAISTISKINIRMANVVIIKKLRMGSVKVSETGMKKRASGIRTVINHFIIAVLSLLIVIPPHINKFF